MSHLNWLICVTPLLKNTAVYQPNSWKYHQRENIFTEDTPFSLFFPFYFFINFFTFFISFFLSSLFFSSLEFSFPCLFPYFLLFIAILH